jgi:MoxR-like ATPase
LDYPSREEEIRIVNEHGNRTGMRSPDAFGIQPVATADELKAAVQAISGALIKPDVIEYVVEIVRATRASPAFETGASPRAAAALAAAARARAILDGRDFVIPDDVKILALPVLRHRVLLSPAAEIEGRTTDETLAAVIEQSKPPR